MLFLTCTAIELIISKGILGRWLKAEKMKTICKEEVNCFILARGLFYVASVLGRKKQVGGLLECASVLINGRK